MKAVFLEKAPVEYNPCAIKTLHCSCRADAKGFALHWHDRMELLRINQGVLTVEDGLRTVCAKAGELVIIPPKMLHKGYPHDQDVKYDVLMFDLRFFYNETTVCQSYLSAVFDGRAVFKTVTDDKDAIACFDAIFQEGKTGSLKTIANVYLLLDLLYQHSLLEFRDQPKTASVKNIIDYMEKNYMSEITVACLCKEFGYTAAHLCRKFKKITGLTPMMYLKLYRLEIARKKIKNQEDSIGNVAAECGFADANYFTRCFKAHFGVSPSCYRKEN